MTSPKTAPKLKTPTEAKAPAETTMTTRTEVTTPAGAKPATASKGTATPKRAAAPKKATAGAKPEFAVVEHTLKCQTSEGEISLDLRVPLDAFEKLSQLEDMSERDSLPFIRTQIMPEDVAAPINALRDGVESMKLIMKWIEAVGERFGASLGELGGSSDS